MTMEERSVWADLLAMASESRVRGVICRAVNIPYSRDYIANFLEVPIEILNSTIGKCLADKNAQDASHRIEIDEFGCIHVTNWEKYQTVPENARSKKDNPPEDGRERELRERRKARQLAAKYPDEVQHKLSPEIGGKHNGK